MSLLTVLTARGVNKAHNFRKVAFIAGAQRYQPVDAFLDVVTVSEEKYSNVDQYDVDLYDIYSYISLFVGFVSMYVYT